MDELEFKDINRMVTRNIYANWRMAMRQFARGGPIMPFAEATADVCTSLVFDDLNAELQKEIDKIHAFAKNIPQEQRADFIEGTIKSGEGAALIGVLLNAATEIGKRIGVEGAVNPALSPCISQHVEHSINKRRPKKTLN